MYSGLKLAIATDTLCVILCALVLLTPQKSPTASKCDPVAYNLKVSSSCMVGGFGLLLEMKMIFVLKNAYSVILVNTFFSH